MPDAISSAAVATPAEPAVRLLTQSLAMVSLASAQMMPVAAAPAAPTSHPARSATDFLGSLGVVTHIDSGNAQWTNAPFILNALKTLGIWTVRDGAPFDYALATMVTLAQAGVRFNLLEANVYSFDQTGQVNAALDVERAHRLEAAVPGSVRSFEGCNEYTTNAYWLDGASSTGNLAWGLADAAALKAAVRADPLFASTPIIAPSAIQLDSLPSFAGLADASNAHIYGGPGQQLQDLIANSLNFARASLPGAPVYLTETGISSAGYGAADWGVTDEKGQAIIDLNALLDGFSAGAAMTFLYELFDEPYAWKSPVEQNFGLFRADGSPKPAAVAIGNLTHLLADDGKGAVAPGSLDYAISGLPSTASSLLLEKSNGTFDLVLWNGRASLFDGSGPVAPAPAKVTIALGQQASAQVYDPVTGMNALASLNRTKSISVQLSADPIVIEIHLLGAAPHALSAHHPDSDSLFV